MFPGMASAPAAWAASLYNKVAAHAVTSRFRLCARLVDVSARFPVPEGPRFSEVRIPASMPVLQVAHVLCVIC